MAGFLVIYRKYVVLSFELELELESGHRSAAADPADHVGDLLEHPYPSSWAEICHFSL